MPQGLELVGGERPRNPDSSPESYEEGRKSAREPEKGEVEKMPPPDCEGEAEGPESGTAGDGFNRSDRRREGESVSAAEDDRRRVCCESITCAATVDRPFVTVLACPFPFEAKAEMETETDCC